jgi:mono/diheme cytochrome c family protein
MHATVIATSDSDYQRWLASAATTELGREEFQGVCATCHGMQGQGGYGPAINQDSLITQVSTLEPLLRTGRGNMPAVGATWTQGQMNAVVAYLKQNIYKGAATSGG